ncbi:MAG: hypothetical protein CMJ89_15510 [Planctomycetes bacterium]|jgi:hypothetical protein|nr:hypothetical protein [Planctomycetota bacterium]
MKWSGFLTIVGLAVLCDLLLSSCMIFGSSYRSPNACENCSQQEGADACCAEDAGECADCGELKGSPECCDPDAERCGDCGKIKGSEGCCN